MQESLIGYLLGALDEHEASRLEARLEQDPQLRNQLRQAARSFHPVKMDDDDIEPPAGLAHGTCQFVHKARKVLSHCYERAAISPSWTLVDMTIAAAIFLAACLLFFPAVNNSRYHAQIAGCQNNLRHLGRALIAYSENAHGLFPKLPETGNLAVAGMYAPTLCDLSYILDDEHHVFLCPATELDTNERFRVPSVEEIEQVQGQMLAVMQRRMGGHYGYAMGYTTKQGKLRASPNLNRTYFAIMSDAPSDPMSCKAVPHRINSHRNVLFESGHVRPFPVRTFCWCGDQLYVNDRSEVSAGLHVGDTVIGRSATAPLLRIRVVNWTQ